VAAEREGVRRARAKAAEADLLIAAFAADATPDDDTMGIVATRPDAILVASKCDLAPPSGWIAASGCLPTSARTGAGLDALKAALAAAATRLAGVTEAPLLTRARHRAALTAAVERLRDGAAAPLPELAAESYRAAVSALGQITGRIDVEGVLDIVFADFCIGK
jgi:tRNA modification GTPase